MRIHDVLQTIHLIDHVIKVSCQLIESACHAVYLTFELFDASCLPFEDRLDGWVRWCWMHADDAFERCRNCTIISVTFIARGSKHVIWPIEDAIRFIVPLLWAWSLSGWLVPVFGPFESGCEQASFGV